MGILDSLITAIFNPARGFYGATGAIAIQCTLEEIHYDEVQITDHPVEQGAQISDHAFNRPAEVVIRAGWSNSGLQSVITDVSDAISLTAAAVLGGNLSSLLQTSSFNLATQTYQLLLALQQSHQPFTIITGKRTYSNMLMRSLAVTTDEKSENALFVTATCKQVIIAYTQVVPFPNGASAMASPQTNAPSLNQGAQTLAPATTFNQPYADNIPGS
jgi:hypothetical protein